MKESTNYLILVGVLAVVIIYGVIWQEFKYIDITGIQIGQIFATLLVLLFYLAGYFYERQNEAIHT